MFGLIKFDIVIEYMYIKRVINETQDRAFKAKYILIVIIDILSTFIIEAIRKIHSDENPYIKKGRGGPFTLLIRYYYVYIITNRLEDLRTNLFQDSYKIKYI